MAGAPDEACDPQCGPIDSKGQANCILTGLTKDPQREENAVSHIIAQIRYMIESFHTQNPRQG